MIEAAKTIRRHFEGVLRWFTPKITNGVLEGINSLIQVAKAQSPRLLPTRNLINIACLIAGRLQFSDTHL